MTAPFTGLIQALQWKSDGFKLALCDPTHTNNHKETEIQKYKHFSYTRYKILNNKNVEIYFNAHDTLPNLNFTDIFY
jgi:hypothetical protein